MMVAALCWDDTYDYETFNTCTDGDAILGSPSTKEIYGRRGGVAYNAANDQNSTIYL